MTVNINIYHSFTLYVLHTNLNGPLAVEICGKLISKVFPLLAIELFKFNIISGVLWSTSNSVISGSIEMVTGKCNALWENFTWINITLLQDYYIIIIGMKTTEQCTCKTPNSSYDYVHTILI